MLSLEGDELNPYQPLLFRPGFFDEITTCDLAGSSEEVLQDG